MTTPLSEPDDVHSQLLLLLAGELTSTEALALEERVAADPVLAAELQILRKAEIALHSGLARLDAATFLPLSAAGAVRHFRRAADLHRQRQIVLPPQPSASRRLNVQWWVYPTAAAALVLVSLMTWWGWHNQDLPSVGQTVAVENQAGPSAPMAALPESPPAGPDVPSALAPGVGSTPPPMAIASSAGAGVSSPDGATSPPSAAGPAEADDLAGVSGIVDAEQQASTLQRRSDPSTMTASIFLNDPDSPLE